MLVGATSFTLFTNKDRDFSYFEFLYGKDKYLAYLRPRGNSTSELDFLVFGMKRDTIVPPEEDNVDFFFSLFDTAAKKFNEQNRIALIGKEENPSFLEEIRSLFLSSYASPIRLPISIPRPRTRAIKSWTEKHTVLVGFIGGIFATVIGALILRYIFGISFCVLVGLTSSEKKRPMKTRLRMRCRSCGHWNRIEVARAFVFIRIT